MPNHKTNLLGKQFGDWTVIAEAPSLKKPYKTLAMWTCQCKCGLIKEVRADDLRNGRSKSCQSCAARKRAEEKNLNLSSKKDLSNRVIGHPRIKNLSGTICPHFTVISYYESDKRGASRWLCKCECGNEFITNLDDIKPNSPRNCGCLNRSQGEIKIADILIANNINFQTEYTFSDLKDKQLLRFDFAIFDNNNLLIKLIEFQGEQHYNNNTWFNTDPKSHDQMKRDYCKQHNISLLEIPYWDLNKIDIDYLLNN